MHIFLRFMRRVLYLIYDKYYTKFATSWSLNLTPHHYTWWRIRWHPDVLVTHSCNNVWMINFLWDCWPSIAKSTSKCEPSYSTFLTIFPKTSLTSGRLFLYFRKIVVLGNVIIRNSDEVQRGILVKVLGWSWNSPNLIDLIIFIYAN